MSFTTSTFEVNLKREVLAKLSAEPVLKISFSSVLKVFIQLRLNAFYYREVKKKEERLFENKINYSCVAFLF